MPSAFYMNCKLAGMRLSRKAARRPEEETPMPAPYDKHRAQLKAILLAWGMPEDDADATTDILSWADLHGVDSHGISMLPGYDRLRRNGRANMEARPRIIKETPVSALVDGDGGLGHVPARFAMQVAIAKAKKSGMAIAAVRNSAHLERPAITP
jgi:LDH2 family malate/lactate/ureidoglycolate dehydrogenase